MLLLGWCIFQLWDIFYGVVERVNIMYLFKCDERIKIMKFGELSTGDCFFFNELPFIKTDSDYL